MGSKWKQLQTHCFRGHEMTPENTYLQRDRRECRRCAIDRQLARNKRLRSTAEGRKRLGAYSKAWAERNPEKNRLIQAQTKRRLYHKDRDRVEAKRAVYVAVKAGKLVRSDHCSRCGLVCKPDGHHTDYKKYLEVEWLCKRCHKAEHDRIRVQRTDNQ
jgi:hypothetical protein